jgi:flagellar motor switch protein FliG
MTTPTKSNVTALNAGARGAAARTRRVPSVSAAQRAAVIITLLGEDTAKPIVEKLDDAALARVVDAIENISVLTREQLVEIVVDFLTQLRANAGAIHGGRDKAREVLSPLLDASRLNDLFGVGFEPVSSETFSFQALGGDVWGRLQKRDPAQIAEYLGRQPPNIIAMVLRKLDPGLLSTILCMLPDEKVSPTLGHMVAGKKVDPEIEGVLERMIDVEFLTTEEVVSAKDDPFLESIGEVLSLLPDQKRTTLISFLKSEHEEKLASIQRGLFTIESLPEILPRNSVPVVFKEIENDDMVKVLASLGMSFQQAADYLLSNISSRMADQYREQVKETPAMSAEVAESVQREFLMKLMELKRGGVIGIGK